VLESFYKTFEDFVVEFSARRFVGALFLAVVGLSGFYFIDRYSPYFTIGRLERAAALLEKLSPASPPSQESGELKELRAAIIRQVRRVVEPPPLIGVLATGELPKVTLWKFSSGVLPWAIVALIYLPSVRVNPTNWNGIAGAVVLGMLFGFLATLFIPDDWVTWKVLVSYGVGHFAFIAAAIMIWQARKNARIRRPA
jgi:hypothetical protein